MGRIDYDRYEIYRNNNGSIDQLPFVKIPNSTSDKYVNWKLGVDRLDKLAKRYYNNEFYDFIILLANPEYISEFDIENGDVIRIPFPLERARTEYENGLKKIKNT